MKALALRIKLVYKLVHASHLVTFKMSNLINDQDIKPNFSITLVQ